MLLCLKRSRIFTIIFQSIKKNFSNFNRLNKFLNKPFLTFFMFPRIHILFGAIFSILIYFILHFTILSIILIFLASVFIDVDHYLWYINRKKEFSLKKAFYFHKNLPINHKPVMHIFHNIEFLAIISILSYFYNIFLFILIGILFHLILDLIAMLHEKHIGREFSLIRYIISRDKTKYL